MKFEADLTVKISIEGAEATSEGAQKIIDQISASISAMGMNGKSGTVKLKVLGSGPIRKGQEPDERSAYESIKRQGQG